jgi:formylmethanofuran dehydrogenase subunit E
MASEGCFSGGQVKKLIYSYIKLKCVLMMNTDNTVAEMIQEMAFKKIVVKAITDNTQQLQFFKSLPKVLRCKIQSFYKASRPQIQCYDCENYFYKLSNINTEEGYLCQPCVEFHDNEIFDDITKDF